jgi:hypothetical protein
VQDKYVSCPDMNCMTLNFTNCVTDSDEFSQTSSLIHVAFSCVVLVGAFLE